ncbi:T9SS type A sorting domain-containing protein [bacterium]|nr:T9SS type A sorting domain-containing protein [bacterium]
MMARTVRPWALLLSLAFFLLATVGYARFNVWEPENGVEIRQGRHVSWVSNSTAEDGNGNFLTVWSDAGTGSMDVYAQLFTIEGTPLWTAPLPIANNPHPEQEARVIRTSDDAWIIAWLDYGEDLEKVGVGRLFLRKLNDSGQDLWPSPVGPVEEASNSYNSGRFFEGLYLFPVSDGGAFVASDLDRLAWVQRVTGDGTVAWPEAIHPLPQLVNRPRCIPDGSDGVIILGHEYFPEGPNHVIGQRISVEGDLLWDEGEEPVSFFNNVDISAIQMTPSLAGDWLLTWSDANHQVQVQKYNSNAEPLWGTEPVVLTDVATSGSLKQVFPLDDGQVLLTWGDWDQGYYQRLGFAGEEPFFYVGTPSPLEEQEKIEFASLLTSGNVLLKTQRFTVQGSDDYLAAISAASEELWSYPIFPYPGSFEYEDLYNDPITFIPDEDSFSLVTSGRVEDRTGMMLHRLSNADGTLLLDEPVELATGLSGETRSPQLIDTGVSLFSYWKDERWGESHHFQILDREIGTPLFESGGRNFFPALDGMASEDFFIESALNVVPSATGGLLVARLETVGEWYNVHVRLQKVSNRGEILWGLGGRVIDDLDSEDRGVDNLQLASLSDGSSILAYNTFSDLFMMQVNLMKFLPDGTLEWELVDNSLLEEFDQERDYHVQLVQPLPNGETLLILNGYDFFGGNSHIHSVCIDAEGDVVSRFMIEITYLNPTELRVFLLEDGSLAMLYRFEGDSLKLDRLSAEGEYITPEEGVTIAPWYDVVDIEHSLVVAENGFGIVTSLEDGYSYHRFTWHGEPVFDEPAGMPLPSGLQYRNALSDGEDGAWLLGWVEDSYGGDIGYVHVNSEGQLARSEYEDGPVTLCDAWFTQALSPPISDGEGGFIATWNDYRGSLNQHLYDDVYAMRVNDFTTGVGDNLTSTLPAEFTLLPAYPNPFNPSTTLTYTIPRDGKVRLAVYDILGREVIRLVDGFQGAGVHRQVWNATSRSGSPVASGTYFVRYDTPHGVQAQKILLLK